MTDITALIEHFKNSSGELKITSKLLNEAEANRVLSPEVTINLIRLEGLALNPLKTEVPYTLNILSDDEAIQDSIWTPFRIIDNKRYDLSDEELRSNVKVKSLIEDSEDDWIIVKKLSNRFFSAKTSEGVNTYIQRDESFLKNKSPYLYKYLAIDRKLRTYKLNPEKLKDSYCSDKYYNSVTETLSHLSKVLDMGDIYNLETLLTDNFIPRLMLLRVSYSFNYY